MSESGKPGREQVLSVGLAAEEANAIVYTIAFEAVTTAEDLDSLAITSQPADLLAIAVRCGRIRRLTAINDQLGWCAQRGGEDVVIVISAAGAVLVELAAVLEATAEDRIELPDAQLERFAFGQAAKAIRAALRGAS